MKTIEKYKDYDIIKLNPDIKECEETHFLIKEGQVHLTILGQDDLVKIISDNGRGGWSCQEISGAKRKFSVYPSEVVNVKHTNDQIVADQMNFIESLNNNSSCDSISKEEKISKAIAERDKIIAEEISKVSEKKRELVNSDDTHKEIEKFALEQFQKTEEKDKERKEEKSNKTKSEKIKFPNNFNYKKLNSPSLPFYFNGAGQIFKKPHIKLEDVEKIMYKFSDKKAKNEASPKVNDPNLITVQLSKSELNALKTLAKLGMTGIDSVMSKLGD